MQYMSIAEQSLLMIVIHNLHLKFEWNLMTVLQSVMQVLSSPQISSWTPAGCILSFCPLPEYLRFIAYISSKNTILKCFLVAMIFKSITVEGYFSSPCPEMGITKNFYFKCLRNM
jgi:hypothetical protein